MRTMAGCSPSFLFFSWTSGPSLPIFRPYSPVAIWQVHYIPREQDGWLYGAGSAAKLRLFLPPCYLDYECLSLASLSWIVPRSPSGK